MTKNIITAFLLLIITFPVMAAQPGGDDNIVAPLPTNPDLGDQNIEQERMCKCDTDKYLLACDFLNGTTSCASCASEHFENNCLYPAVEQATLGGEDNHVDTWNYTNSSTSSAPGDYTGCEWSITCEPGHFVDLVISQHTSSGCGPYPYTQPCYLYYTKCSPCASNNPPYYNDPNKTNTYYTDFSLLNGKTPSCSDTPTDKKSFIKPYLKDADSDYDINAECSYCTGDTIVKSTSDGCISCAAVAAGTKPNKNHGQCICQEGYYYVTTENKITTTENNNNACKESPDIVYKWTNFDTGANETTTDGKVPLTGNYTTLSSNDQTYQQITNTSIFPIHGWTYDTYDNNCNKSTPSTTLIAGNSISRTLLDNALKCIFKRTGNEDFAIQPAFTSKKIEYQRKLADGTNITLCRATTAPTQECKPDAANLCTAAELTKCTEFNNFTGYYASEEKWHLTDDQGNKIKDANGNQISYAPGDTVKYVPQNSTTPVYLTLEVKQCEAGYYCTNGKRTKCPAGMTSDAGSDEITDCKTGTETKVCDDTGNCITLPSGLTLRQK